MHLSPPIAFALWIPISLFLSYRFPPRIAILASLLGGWAVLPGADYIYAPDVFPYWVLGVCLPSKYFFTKATITSIGALAGWLVFRARDVQQLRPSACDIPIVLWCCVPLFSVGMHAGLQQGLIAALYQSLAWGVPWLLGRIYFSCGESLLLFAKACILAAAAYIPICLLEWITGPQLYYLAYGYQPYRYVGAARYIGSRPVGFLEDGNQLGIWMAASALLAAAIALHRLTRRMGPLSANWIAWILAAATVLCQSAGSIILYLLLLPLTLLKRRTHARIAILAVASMCILCVLILVVERGSLRSLAQGNHFVHAFAELLDLAGRRSFAWRLARDGSHMAVALHKPLLGYGEWDWWRTGDARPWSLWLLVFGMYGIVGLAACAALFAMPVFRTVLYSELDNQPLHFQLRVALTGVIVMLALDNLLNGAFILPYLLAMAGMSSPESIQPERLEANRPQADRPQASKLDRKPRRLPFRTL